jgi:RecA/RadA recombinase
MPRPKKIKEKKTRVSTKAPREVKKVKYSENSLFFNTLVKETGNDLAQAASQGIIAGDIKSWIDTGVYLLNAQLSGSLYGGCPDNKIVVFAGPEATGKTFFVLSIVKHYLESNPKAGVFYFESESAIDKRMLEQRGIDISRVFVVPVSTVQEWRTQTLKVLKGYSEIPENKRQPLMFVLDSLGMLSTTKEMEDSESGSEKADMTRARLIKAAFRTITLKLGKLGVPLLVTNHTYDEMGKMFSTRKQSGGSGILYSNSMTVFLSKAKDKDGDDVIGSLISSTLKKGRITKENTLIKVKLNYASGLDKYFGLLDLASDNALIKKLDRKYEFPDGKKEFEKKIYENPLLYFTPEFMEKLEVLAKKTFLYGEVIEENGDDTFLEKEIL